MMLVHAFKLVLKATGKPKLRYLIPNQMLVYVCNKLTTEYFKKDYCSKT